MTNPQPKQFTATSRTGTITVRTTEQGLPLGISVDTGELRGDPDQLAGEILRLCRRSATRAALQRRAEFEAAGVDSAVLARMGLPTREDVARQEYAEEAEYENEPQSWLRSV
ncbi:hypothetical protein BOX37_03970 [Nocardia mangyaensis]|uniref:YbaB/EbfC family DNA-binding protein n=1 Tax=Nocardia mangyaensis TaxID=2213200 RepID=A0A1J0VMM9_9NOCA|nr:hypothetical protein [Nocardia mangyaensis]APE33261.1 hypothetical protein BOX37_03970 [Nocardia mangyaensis]